MCIRDRYVLDCTPYYKTFVGVVHYKESDREGDVVRRHVPVFRGGFSRLRCLEWQARGHSPEDYYSMVDSLHIYEAEQDEQQKGHKADVWIQLEQQSLSGDDSQRKCDLVKNVISTRS